MSTYTDLHLRNKENIAVLRMPGNPYDGMTPQRVIFANPENIYNGKFVGELSTTSASFNDVTMTNCTILGGVLSNAILKYEGQTLNIIDIIEYTTDISNLQVSAKWLSGYADALSDAIGLLSNGTSAFNEISSALSGLSIEFVDYSMSADTAISEMNANLSGLSNDFIDYSNETDGKIADLQKQVQGGLTYKGILSIDYITVSSLTALLTANGVDADSCLSVGYFYVAQTKPENRQNHYIYDGVELECGDWLTIVDSAIAKNLTSGDVNVLDAQDYGILDKIQANTDAITELCSTVKTDISSAIDENISRISETNAYADAISSYADDVSALASANTNGINDLKAYADGISAAVNATNGRISDLKVYADEVSSYADGISSVVAEHNKQLSTHMSYVGTLTAGYSTIGLSSNRLSLFLFENFLSNADYVFNKGTQFRFLSAIMLCTDVDAMQFYANDYAIFNKNVMLKNAQLSDFDIIRDSQSEGEELLKRLYRLSDEVSAASSLLSTNIETLSIEIYDVLSAKQDALTDEQISAIDSVVDERATVFDFGNGDISAFNWVGEIDISTMVDFGLFDIDIYEWIVNPSCIKIGNLVTSIGYKAFSRCASLASIQIPDSIESVGEQAFNGCISLTSIKIPDSVTSIGNAAFLECKFLTSIQIPDSVERIGYEAFAHCTSLASIKIPDSVESIENYAFYGCTSLTSVVVHGKTQAEAEALLAYAIVPISYITTWNDASKEWTSENFLSDVPSAYSTYEDVLSALSNDGYATIEYVDDCISALSIDNYALTSEVSSLSTKLETASNQIAEISSNIVNALSVVDSKDLSAISLGDVISCIWQLAQVFKANV